MRLEERRWVDRPQNEVFDYTADFNNIEHWDPGVVASKKISDGEVREGTEFELEVKFGRGTVPMVYTVTEYEPDSRVVLIGKGDELEAIDEIRFDRQDNLTVIDYTADLTFHNYFRFLGPFIAPALKKVGTKALDGLARELVR